MATNLTISNIPTLPNTADTFLIAGWIGQCGTTTQNFSLLSDNGNAGLIVAFSCSAGESDWVFKGYDTDGFRVFSGDTSASDDLSADWASFALSGEMSSQTLQFLFNSTIQDMSDTGWLSNNPVAYFPLSDPWEIGPPTKYPGIGMYDFRFGADEGFFDLSDPTNVAKLFGASNTPISWGANGELVTGSRPAVFLHGDHTSYASNLGTGGAFTVGSLALTNIAGPT